MKRRLFNAVAVVSLVLAVAVLLLTFTTQKGWAVAAWRPKLDQTVQLIFGYGTVCLTAHEIPIPGKRWTWYWTDLPEDSPAALCRLQWLGFGYGTVWGEGFRIAAPSWFVLVCTTCLPAYWVWRRSRAKRPDVKPCPACGYDLRGSESKTCPECGADREASA